MPSPLHPPAYHQGQKASETGQKVAKVRFYLPALVFSREFARPKGAKSKDIFERWGEVVQDARALAACFWLVHRSRGVRASRLQDLPEVGSGPLVCVPPLLSACLLCLWCVGLKYAFISHFKDVFSGFWGWYMGSYCLRALRGLCGFCARVWLGGFGACGVFALVFILLPCFLSILSFCLAFCLCVCSLLMLFACLVCWCCLVVLWVLLVLLFPFRTIRKKKGREGLPLASSLVLLWCVVYSIAASGIRKLLQVVSILRFFPAIHATVKWSQL